MLITLAAVRNEKKHSSTLFHCYFPLFWLHLGWNIKNTRDKKRLQTGTVFTRR